MKIQIALASGPKGPSRFITLDEVRAAAQQFKLHGVNYDQKNGKGVIPHNQEIGHKGFSVLMPPSVYLSLCYPARVGEAETVGLDYLTQWIKDGNPIGSPWLKIEIPRDENHNWTAAGAYVTGHEGRNRAMAIRQLFGDVDMMVHITSSSMDNNRDMSEQLLADLRAGVKSQTGRFIEGPLWRA